MSPSSGATNFIKAGDIDDIDGSPYIWQVFGDANHNGKIEYYRDVYVSSTSWFFRVYEIASDLSYTVTTLPITVSGLPWDLGDTDGNGLMELITQWGDDQGNRPRF
jgi:hypothetical protein